ncbi:hypothetical protein Acr_04g0003360 [Actinidia rufa]|uniref:Uncharacterized protein n=1 Tax=Actinidia rufa TaxID=165716 RepID=A0A7J0EGJ2_9ERIC|nr:hypothetical protein Acr_04g0003360 [Actinidia rufa]
MAPKPRALGKKKIAMASLARQACDPILALPSLAKVQPRTLSSLYINKWKGKLPTEGPSLEKAGCHRFLQRDQGCFAANEQGSTRFGQALKANEEDVAIFGMVNTDQGNELRASEGEGTG